MFVVNMLSYVTFSQLSSKLPLNLSIWLNFCSITSFTSFSLMKKKEILKNSCFLQCFPNITPHLSCFESHIILLFFCTNSFLFNPSWNPLLPVEVSLVNLLLVQCHLHITVFVQYWSQFLHTQVTPISFSFTYFGYSSTKILNKELKLFPCFILLCTENSPHFSPSIFTIH